MIIIAIGLLILVGVYIAWMYRPKEKGNYFSEDPYREWMGSYPFRDPVSAAKMTEYDNEDEGFRLSSVLVDRGLSGFSSKDGYQTDARSSGTVTMSPFLITGKNILTPEFNEKTYRRDMTAESPLYYQMSNDSGLPITIQQFDAKYIGKSDFTTNQKASDHRSYPSDIEY